MKIKIKMIDKELRFRGLIVKIFLGSYSKIKFKFCQLILNIFMKGRARTRKILYEEAFIKNGNEKLRVCIYKSKTESAKTPCMLWLHGGGYAIGVPEQDVKYALQMVLKNKVTVVMPDYTLSIKSPFPAALNDSYQTLLWIKENAKELNIDDSQIFIGGTSAGGGLAVATTILARDKNEVNIAYQMPLYPMLSSTPTATSLNNNAPVWNSKSNRNAWKLYVRDSDSKYASPSKEEDYSSLPPMTTFIGDIEPFYEETLEYIKKMEKENIRVSYKIYSGCYHAFDVICPRSKKAKDARSFMEDELRYACNNLFKKQKD